MALQETTATAATPKAPPTAGAPLALPPAGDVRQIPHKLIDASPLNPRKEPDAEKITELASSILTQGILQNLVLRPHPKKDGRYEIAAGESRWRAVGSLIHDGDLPKDYALPALVRDLSDRQLIELALTENVQRRDLTAMEEAEAFKRLVDLKVGTDEIADRVGCSRRHVQLRLALLKLEPKVQKALAAGDITAEVGRKIAMAPAKRQAEILENVLDAKGYGENLTADDVADMAREHMVNVRFARFDLKLYKGEFVTDEDEPKVRYFADLGQYEKLQREWIKEEGKRLRAEYPDRVWEETGYGNEIDEKSSMPYGWTKAAKGDKDRGALVVIGNDLSCRVFKDVKEERRNQVTRDTATGAPKAPAKRDAGEAPSITTPPTLQFLGLCRNIKTQAMQDAVANDPEIAKRLLCLGLMGGRDCTRLRIDSPNNTDNVLSKGVIEASAKLRARLGDTTLKSAPKPGSGWALAMSLRDGGYGGVTDASQVAAIEALGKISGKDLDQLLAVLAAPLVGTFNNYRPAQGDEPPALAFARMATVKLPADCVSAEFIDQARKPQLAAMVNDLGITVLVGGKTKEPLECTGPQLREALREFPDKLKGYVPPWLRFAAAGDITAAVKKLGKVAAPASPGAKAKREKKKDKAKAKAKGKKK